MILFFVRRYNDIDHTVPIIHRMAKDGFSDMIILCSNMHIDIKSDFRLKFLDNTYGIKSFYNTHYFWPDNIRSKIKAFLSSGLYYKKAITRKKIDTYIKSIIHNKLKKNNVTLLLFDWQDVDKYIFTSTIMSTSKELNIPNICLPHGVALYTNDDWVTNTHAQNGTIPISGITWSYFDDIVFQYKNEGHYRIATNHATVKSEKLHVMGSARFCEEWRQVYNNIMPKTRKPLHKSDKVKIVYMDHSSGFRINKNVVAESIKKISQLDFIDIIVKPSTTSTERKKGGISSEELFSFSKVCYDKSSFELIEWADVIMGTTSSILLEVMLTKKIFVYPKYFHENEMSWEKMNACWTVNNYQELEDAMQKITLDHNYRPYSQDSVDKYIENVVYCGNRNRDVLGEYKDFILSRA